MIALLWAGTVAVAASVSIQTADGVSLRATTEQTAASKRAAVLVHMEGRSSADWASLADRLSKSGISSIAPDLRGHGDSGGERTHTEMVQDVRAATDWLAAQGAEEIVCIGAEIGANLCLMAADDDPRISAAALLSPRLNPSGLNAPRAMQGWTSGSVLAVASTDDSSGSKCVDLLARIAGEDRAEVVVLSDAGVGTQMLSRAPSLEGRLIEWLSASSTLSGADLVGSRPDTTDSTTVEAEGEMLRTHQ
ncbi:MAG: alpha-beta hydrolase superfamily lysophospholipase [Myxococcota bacterium]|jgi:alpha-beta hydrolase superfamily lysophospholipase